MRAPPTHDAAIPVGWQRSGGGATVRPRMPSLARWTRRASIAAVTGIVLAASLALAAYLATSSHRPPLPARPAAHAGTALLGTATCTDWQGASAARRLTIIDTLGVAATQPDPENRGATLERGAAYGLFQRVCSTTASRSVLLYEAYNRAASFQSVQLGSTPPSGSGTHR